MSDVVRKIDFGKGRNWTAVANEHHLEWAGNPNFPDYMRVVFVAYGRHAANGHASLARAEKGGSSELAAYLVRKDGTIPERTQVWSAINKAIGLGYLLEGSKAECLIVNRDNVQRGDGNPDKPCKRSHPRPNRRMDDAPRNDRGRYVKTQSVGDETCHSGQSVGDEDRHSEPSVGDEDRHSTLSPSISSPQSETPTLRAAS